MITFILAVCGNVDYVYSFPQSPPSRAAWIEIAGSYMYYSPVSGRRLHGRRGLKFLPISVDEKEIRRRLHGRRGLKCQYQEENANYNSRRLHGRRGLKLRSIRLKLLQYIVAAFTGGVD